MPVSNDVCVSCNKAIKESHKIIFCKHCKLYVHKKCTKLKQGQLKRLNPGEWECSNCRKDEHETVENNIHDINNLNENWNIVDVDLNKYEKMAFDPLRYESTTKESDLGNENLSNVKCKYVTNVQLNQMLSNQNDSLTLLNANIRSIGKKLDILRMCLKTLDHKFTAIGLSETHLKVKPLEYYHQPGYNFEYMNRVGREKGGVGLFVSNDVKYKVRQDLYKNQFTL